MVKYCFVLGLFCFLIGGCATTNYVGETYTPTQHVDVFFNKSEIGRPYKTMGIAKTKGSQYMTYDAIEKQLVKDAMAKGADAIVIEGMSSVRVGATSSTYGESKDHSHYIVTKGGKLKNVGGDNHYNTTSTTTDIQEKVITAHLIKYK